MRIQLLFLEAEALYFIEILSGIERDHIICANTNHRFVCGIASCVKC